MENLSEKKHTIGVRDENHRRRQAKAQKSRDIVTMEKKHSFRPLLLLLLVSG